MTRRFPILAARSREVRGPILQRFQTTVAADTMPKCSDIVIGWIIGNPACQRHPVLVKVHLGENTADLDRLSEKATLLDIRREVREMAVAYPKLAVQN